MILSLLVFLILFWPHFLLLCGHSSLHFLNVFHTFFSTVYILPGCAKWLSILYFYPRPHLLTAYQISPLNCLQYRKTQIEFLTPSCPLLLPPSSSMCIPKLILRHPSQRPDNLSWLLLPSMFTSNKTSNSVQFASKVSLTLFPSLYSYCQYLSPGLSPGFLAPILHIFFPEGTSLKANLVTPPGL